MKSITRGLTIDNGGSEIRTLPIGEGINSSITKFDNDFMSIDRKNFRIKETEDPLALCDIIQAPKKEYEGIIAQGIVGKMYDGEGLTINSQGTKTGSLSYYRQFIYAIARDAMQAIMNGEVAVVEKQRINNFADVQFNYCIVTCIPIREYSGKTDCADLLKKNIAGSYVVTFPLITGGNNTVSFVITKENVGVVPEGGVAMVQMRNKISKEDLSLVVDMGHVTTDIALFKGEVMYGNRVMTSMFAGSTLLANIRAALMDEGFILNDEQVQRVVETGKVKVGINFVDVSDILAEQKNIFVRNYLKPEIIQLLNMNAVNASQVQNLIPIGAAMNYNDEDSTIVSAILKECGMVDARVNYLAKDLRYVNIESAARFTRVLLNRMMRVDGVAV